MLSIIVRKKTIKNLIALVAAGLAILCLGWRFDLFKINNNVPETRSSHPASGAVSFERVGQVEPKEDNNVGEEKVEKIAGEGYNFFVEYRLERERTRGQRVEWLREVINSDDSNAETKQKAQEDLMAISENMTKEIDLENMLRAKGFDDAVVRVDGRTVTVIVAAGSLAEKEAAVIKELVSKATGMDIQNIIIITKRKI